VGISTAFGCTIQGRVDPEEVVRLVQAVLDAGVDAVSLADTVGYADPAWWLALFERVLRVAGDKLTCATSTTRAAWAGQRLRGAAAGHRALRRLHRGIGGCPHAPGASGNVATEDLAYMLHSMGIETGLDFDRCSRCAARSAKLAGRRATARHDLARRPAEARCRRRPRHA
jgi:hydroxymethylglutaryl-CoA lyase